MPDGAMLTRIAAVVRLLTWAACATAWTIVSLISFNNALSSAMRRDARIAALCFFVGFIMGVGVIWMSNSRSDSQAVAQGVTTAIVILALGGALYASLAWVTDAVQPRSLCLILLFVGVALAGTFRRPEAETPDREQ